MKRILAFLIAMVSLVVFSACSSETEEKTTEQKVNSQSAQDTKDNNEHKEEIIEPGFVQELSVEEAMEHAEKEYGGEGMILRHNGTYQQEDGKYYVFEVGSEIEGSFSKDFSIVVNAQSGEMFEGEYDLETQKINNYNS